MKDLAFLFPGQGSQYAGMGKQLAEEYPEARQAFEDADEAVGFPLSRLCFEGPEEELKKTENTQPALLAVSIAAYRVLESQGYRPGVAAGHSLGEYSALVAAGSLGFQDAIRLVRKRGQYMQAAVPEGVGAMAAILKLPDGQLASILQAAAEGEVVSAANLNSPDQVVIAGHKGAVERAMNLARAAGAKRAIALPVSAPFHCALMIPAQQRLISDLLEVRIADPAFPVINNWRAAEVTEGAQVREGLAEQVPNPVLWVETIRRMAAMGIKRFVEIGPGSVLLGLCRSIAPELQGVRFGEPNDWTKVKSALA